jgi:hypothetical protein
LKTLNLSNTELLRHIDMFYTQVDGLDIMMFNNDDFVQNPDTAVANTTSTNTLNNITPSANNITTSNNTIPSSTVVNL